jgi:hypothetical protein
MLDFLKNEQIVNTCVIILLIAILVMTFINFSQINNNGQNQENYCGCGQPQLNNITNNTNTNTDINNNNNVNVSNNKLVLYYAMWCGYSRQFLPIWEQVKSVISNTSDLNTTCEQYDCEAQKQSCQGINGFPSIILIKPDGTKIQYQNERSPEAILAFVNANK